MYKNTLSLMLLTAVSTNFVCQSANINGCVKSKETGENLSYVTVLIKGSNIGTTTDENGHFAFNNIKEGSYTVTASGIGYKSQDKQIEVASENAHVDFKLLDDSFQLEQIVVTGNKSEVVRRNSSSLINVINGKVFELTSCAALADGLNMQPGVRIEDNCQNCGFTQVRINGLDGHYSQILLDSRPVYSALTGVYGLEQIPANMIERVEVMRGGGSALYGSSAIGGTINIITRDAIENSAELSHNLSLVGKSSALDNNTTFNASLVSDNHKAGIFLYGQNRNRDSYDHDKDGFTEIPMLKSQTIGFRSFLKPSQNSRIALQYHTTHEFRRGGDSLQLQPFQVQICEQTEHYINGGGANFDLYSPDYKNKLNIFASLQNTKRNSYYGSNYDQNAYGWTKDFVLVSGAQYTRQFSNLLFMPAEFVGGVEYNYNYLQDVASGYNHDTTQKISIYSAYLQNEWRNDLWGFLISARIDKHSFLHNPVISPRANIRFNPNKNFNFRATYSTGFRAPQAFDEDFHIAIVGGERVTTILAKDLKQEKSNSFSLSADMYHTFGDVQTNLLVEGFYTKLSDVFALRKLGTTDAFGNAILERYNGIGATVFGTNIEAKAAFNSKLQAQVGVTLQKSEYSEPEQWSENDDVPPSKKLFRTPNTYAYLTATYTPIKPLAISLTGNYTGSMLVQHMEGSGTPIDVAVKTPDFVELNCKVSYNISLCKAVKAQLSAGINNIFNSFQDDFDKGADRDSGYMYGPRSPRTSVFGVKLSF